MTPMIPGGATKYGVTIKTMRGLGLDLSGDGKITTQDVKALTRAQAREVLRAPLLSIARAFAELAGCRCNPASLTCMRMRAATRCGFCSAFWERWDIPVCG